MLNPTTPEVTTVKTADSLIIELNDHSKAILRKIQGCSFRESHGTAPSSAIRNERLSEELGELAEINEPVRKPTTK